MLISKFGGEDLEEALQSLEARCGIALPSPYRTFLLRYNGGYTPKTRFRAKGISTDVRGFFGAGPVRLPLDGEPLERWVEQALFPVACDSFGNRFLLRINEGNGIFFADHEKGMALSLAADGFPAFLRACKSGLVPEAARRSVEERRAALTAAGRAEAITPALVEMWRKELEKYAGMVQEEVIL